MNGIESLDDIVVFVAVVEEGGFAKAAERLGISSAQVSKRVSRLESHLEITLLTRTTRRLTLTEAGQAYFNRVHSIPSQICTAKEETKPFNDGMHGKLKVIVPYGFDNSLRELVLPAYMQDFPNVALDIHVVEEPYDYLHTQFDVLVTGKQPHEAFPDSSLVSRRFLDLPAGLYASPAYLERCGEPKTPDDLVHHRCMSFAKANRWPFYNTEGQLYYLSVKLMASSNSSGVLAGLTLAGQGICYGFDYMFKEGRLGRDIIKVLCDYTPQTLLEIYLFYPKADFLPLKTKTFIERMVQAYEQ